MNQEKIGKFIANLRKQKNMTQEQLAERLNVSSKSVSRWECGKCFPDVSLLPELCDLLNISLNELLSGKKIETENYREKAEENIIKILENIRTNDNSEKIRRMIFGVLVTVIGLIFTVLFLINAQQHPWLYNDIDGLLGSLLGTETLIPFIISIISLFGGLGYCFYNAFKK